MVSAASLFAQNSASLKKEFLANYDDTAKKFISLAEKVPADKYSYKPGDGVRTIAQVFIHIAGANVMIPAAPLGLKAPADFKLSRDSEKTLTDKEQIVAALKTGMQHGRSAVEAAFENPDKPAKLFGRETTNAGVALLLITHMHEHLGQSIAYARGAGVTPPWSEGR
jgi:uncharacterized damage-inducible protein DinB